VGAVVVDVEEKTYRSASVRQLNWALLIGTAVVLLLSGVGAYFLRDYQVHRTARTYWDRALALEAEGEGQQAASYLFRYTRFRPEDSAARIKLAKIYDDISGGREGKRRGVDLYYQAIGVAEDGEKLALRRRLADLLLETNQLPQAKAEALEIRSVLSGKPDDPDAERVLADVLYRQFVTGVIGDQSVAGKKIGEIVRRANELNPKNVRLAQILAEIYRTHPELLSGEILPKLERDSKADEVMTSLVAADPGNPDVRLANFGYRYRYRLSGVDEELDFALELGPENIEVRLAAAEYLRIKGLNLLRNSQSLSAVEGGTEPGSDEAPKELFAQARKHLEQVLDSIDPDSEAAHIALGDVYSAEERSAEAVSAWERGIELVGDASLALNMRLAESLARTSDPEAKDALRRLDQSLDARRLVLSSEAIKSLTRTRDFISALGLLQQGKPSQAIPILKPIVSEARDGRGGSNDSIRALQMLAQAHTALEQWGDAAGDFESAIELVPDDSAWRFKLEAAMMWQKASQPQRAIQHLEDVVAVVDAPGLWLQIARSHYQAIVRHPKDERDWRPFEEALAKTKEAMNGKEIDQTWLVDLLEANYRFVASANQQEGHAQALAILRRVDEGRPRDNVALCSALVSAYEFLGETDRADERLGELDAITTDTHIGYLKRAEVLAQRKQNDKARETLLAGIAQLPANEQLPLRKALVQLSTAQGEFDRAEAELVSLFEADKNDPQPLFLLLELSLRRGKLAEAARWESALEQTEGHISPLGRYFRIWRLVASAADANDSGLRQAIREQGTLSSERPNWILTHFAAALVYEKLGQFAKASESLEVAISLGDGRASTYERLVRVLSVQGRFSEADTYLRKLEQRIPSSPNLSSLAIRVAAQMDDVNRAEKLARDGVEHRPEDPLAQLWLGQVLLAQQKYEEAEQACRKARDLAPEDVRTWNGLFACYLRTGRTLEASQLLADLPKQVKLPAGDLAFIQAQGYELLGDREAAKQQYAVAEKEHPQHLPLLMRIARFYLSEDVKIAENALRKALEIDANSGPARRLLAATLANDPANWDEISRLLTAGGDAADQRVQAALLQRRQSDDRVADLESARKILEKLVLRATNPADADRLLLGLTYAELSKVQLTSNSRDKLVRSAKAQFRPLVVNRAQPNPAYLAVYSRFLLEHDDLDEAKQQLTALEQANPDTLLFVSLKARWLHADDQNDMIEPLVEGFANKLLEKLESDESKLELFSSIGQIYSNVKNHAAAQRWFDQLASAGAERFGPLAMSLAAQGRNSQAVQLCLRAAESDETPLPALVLASILVRASDYQPPIEAEELIAKAIEKHAQNTRLLASVANLRLVQNDSNAAIELYRKIVELEPRDVAALNNLATLLGDQKEHASEALQIIDRAIRQAGPLPPLLDTKGTILIRIGKLDAAVAALETAADSPQADPRYRFHLAVALEAANDSRRAKSELLAAINDDLSSQILTALDQANLAAMRQKYGI